VDEVVDTSQADDRLMTEEKDKKRQKEDEKKWR
jgi:hypothetical protein